MKSNISTPQLTVLMAVFNSEKYVKEAVESILNQSFKTFEFIIINDGSTDNTLSLIEHYAKKDPRVRLFHNKENIGLSASLNFGLNLSRTPLIARMDADDIAHPTRLIKQLEFMRSHPEITVCGSSLQLYENPEITWKPPTKHKEIVTMMLFENSICHPTTIFRKEIVFDKHGGYAPDFYKAQDYELWQRLSESLKIRFANIPEVLLFYRIHPNLDRTPDKRKQKQLANIVRLRALKRLGLEPNEDEFYCHLAVCNPKESPSLDLKKCRNWIEKIESTNQNHLVFSVLHLDSELRKRWLNLCLLSSPSSILTGLEYIKGKSHIRLQSNIYQITRMVWRFLKKHFFFD